MKTKTIICSLSVIILAGCCRPATEYNMSKWERVKKFEKKVSYVKYPGKKKIVIKY